MPSIKLSDKAGADFDVELAERSVLLGYLRQVPRVVVENASVADIGGLTLDEPAVRSLNAGLRIGQDTNARAGGGFDVIVREPGKEHLFPGPLDAAIEVPPEACYVRTALELSAGAAPFEGAIEAANYRRYPLAAGVTLLDALREGIGAFVVPSSFRDLEALPVHGVASVKLTGAITFTATANLLAATNPLASTALPGPLPALSLRAGASIQAGASFEITGRYEVRAHKFANGRLHVGWYREAGSEFQVRATATAGAAGEFGETDLLSMLLGAISSSAAAERDELLRAGLDEDRLQSIQEVVKAAVNRNLELSLSSELGLARSGAAAFLYEIDPPNTTPESREAIGRALAGDLGALHAVLPGVSCLRTLRTAVQAASLTWEVNLLGIYNFTSVEKLLSESSVLYEPATGALVISDRATHEKIRSSQVNFGADTQKLRRVLAEAFLITAAYKGAGAVAGAPALRCSHTFFELRNETGREHLLPHLRAAAALGLVTEDEMNLRTADGFGRTTVLLQTEYDDNLTTALFLDPDARPLPIEFYESVGRAALLVLVAESGPDAARRLPALDDRLWQEMKRRGQFNFKPLFPGASPPLLGAITADYSTIVWWAEAMAGAAERLAAIRRFFMKNPAAAPDNPDFLALRKKLADHLEKVAATTREEFGRPWGLIAMYEASQRRAAASALIASPAFTLRKASGRPALAGGRTG